MLEDGLIEESLEQTQTKEFWLWEKKQSHQCQCFYKKDSIFYMMCWDAAALLTESDENYSL